MHVTVPYGPRILLLRRELIMEDQLLRALGIGDDPLTNPHALNFRRSYARTYYQFRPVVFFWVLVRVHGMMTGDSIFLCCRGFYFELYTSIRLLIVCCACCRLCLGASLPCQ
jgi:hypothetical protein